jgi:uncharacterized protein
MYRELTTVLASTIVLITLSAAATPPQRRPAGPRQIDWDVLLPEKERAHFSVEPPAPEHDYLGEKGKPVRQRGSADVNPALDGVTVKLPGFIVPLTVTKEGVVSEFFLVPYLGACIHVPPPPPNQLVYVETSRGMALKSLDDAYWITGTMHTQTKGTRVAKAAYVIDATKVELYKY